MTKFFFRKKHFSSIFLHFALFILHFDGIFAAIIRRFPLSFFRNFMRILQKIPHFLVNGMEGSKFKGLTFYKLLCPACWDSDEKEYKDSESEIFNEFWLRRW